MNIVKIKNSIHTKRENLILRLSSRFGSELGRSLLGSAYFFDLEFKGPVLQFLKNDIEGFKYFKIIHDMLDSDHRNFNHDELVELLCKPEYESSFDALSQNNSFMRVYSEIHKFRTSILLQERDKVTGSSIFTSKSAQQSMQLKDIYSKRRGKIVTIALEGMKTELNGCIANFINNICRKVKNKSEMDVNDPLFSISKKLEHSLGSKPFKEDIKKAFQRYVSDYLSINLYKYIDFEEAGKLLPKKIGFYKYDFTFISIALGILKISEENKLIDKLIDDLFIEFSRNYLQFYIDEFNKKASAEKTSKVLIAKKTKNTPTTIHPHKPNIIQPNESTTNPLPPELENIVQQIQLKDPNSSFAKNLSKAYNRSKQFTVTELIDILSDYFDESTIEQFVDMMDNYGMVFVNDNVTSADGIESVVDTQENQTIDNQFGLGVSIINELQGLLVGNNNISHHHVVYFYKEAGFIFDDEYLFLSQCEVMTGSNTNSMYKKLLKYLLYPDNYQLKYYTHNHNKTKVCVMDLWNGHRIIFIRNNNQKHRVVMIGNHDLYMYYLDQISRGLYGRQKARNSNENKR